MGGRVEAAQPSAMAIPPVVVQTARFGWHWQWQQLMGGLGSADADGNYTRPVSDHLQGQVPERGDLNSRKADDQPILIVGRSCPWAHRTWLVRRLRRIENTLQLMIASPDHRGGRWVLKPAWRTCQTLLDVHQLCGAPPSHRATVPVLIDPIKGNQPRILCNDSAPLVEMLNQWPSGDDAPDLCPVESHDAIQRWHDLLQPHVNDGVYRCGFARNQRAFEKAETALFQALETVNDHLAQNGNGPWLCGQRLTLADVRLFPTLIRWETVYAPLFRCDRTPLWQFPHLWEWRRRLFVHPGVRDSCDAHDWRQDYFEALFPLNPSGIVPSTPDLIKLVTSEVPR